MNGSKGGRHKRTVPLLSWFLIIGSVFAFLVVCHSLWNIIQHSSEQPARVKLPPGATIVPAVTDSKSVTLVGKPKIAYIFAGSVRSFLCPQVHWTIRLNLMDALGGEAFSFIRVSLEDNKNTKTGNGVVITPDHNTAELNATFDVLYPRTIEYFHLSTQEAEMQHNFPSLNHTIFRENDQRRYSMFYHRCMAYRMAQRYEQEHGIRFDWVVLVRLDAGWLEPVLPISHFSNDRVWLTETGFVPYNDQFMLIPRQFSDYLYDLNTKAQYPVYCLGGPDVERWKCNSTVLEERGVSREKIDATLALCCSDVFGNNTLGYSETIHLRHLLAAHIPVSMGRFPVYLTRKLKRVPCYADCPRVQYNFKETAFTELQRSTEDWKRMDPADTRAVPISETDAARCGYLHHQLSPWQPITASRMSELRQNDSSVEGINAKQLDLQQNLYPQWSKLPPSLQLNPLSFATWRIHPAHNVDGCLTTDMKNLTLHWEPCNTLLHLTSARRHDPRHIFILQVVPHSRSVVRDLRLYPSDKELPAYSTEDLLPLTTITIQRRVPGTFNLLQPLLCLTLVEHTVTRPTYTKLPDGSAIPEHEYNEVVPSHVHLQVCDPKKFGDLQQFMTVQGVAMGNHQQSTVGQIIPARYRDHCVIRGNTRAEGLSEIMNSVDLKVIPCASREEATTSRKYFEFEYIRS